MDKIIEKSGLGEGHSGFLPDGARCSCTSVCLYARVRAWPCACMHGMALAGLKQGLWSNVQHEMVIGFKLGSGTLTAVPLCSPYPILPLSYDAMASCIGSEIHCDVMKLCAAVVMRSKPAPVNCYLFRSLAFCLVYKLHAWKRRKPPESLNGCGRTPCRGHKAHCRRGIIPLILRKCSLANALCLHYACLHRSAQADASACLCAEVIAGQFRDIVRNNANRRAESEAVLVACMQHVLYRTVRLNKRRASQHNGPWAHAPPCMTQCCRMLQGMLQDHALCMQAGNDP